MRFVAFDLETTGFLPGIDRIVEIGAVRFVEGQVEAVFSTLVDPLMPIPEAASRVNGIFNEMVTGKPTIESLLPSFAEFCGHDPMVAHNAAFDFQFLVSEIQKHETPAPKGIVLDTFTMAKKIFPGLANYKLGTLVQHLQIPSGQFHRAEEDASYCGQLFIKMIERMTGSLAVPPPLENLITLCGKTAVNFPQIIPQPKQLNFF